MFPWLAVRALLVLLLGTAALIVLTGVLTGDLGGLWDQLRGPLLLLAGLAGAFMVGAAVVVRRRMRNRRTRVLARYQLLLSSNDEATRGELTATADALVQVLRVPFLTRLTSGQPWAALEVWCAPPSTVGETSAPRLYLLCEPATQPDLLAILRRVTPNIMVGTDRDTGEALRYPPPAFTPDHLMRVQKSRREWELPIVAQKPNADGSNSRTVMASTMRLQQEVGREGYVSCVRVCIMPASPAVDREAALRLKRMAERQTNVNAAVSADITEAQKAGGGTVAFVEYQAAVQYVGEQRDVPFSELQTVCKRLLSPGMSHQSVNTLVERHMFVRQAMYGRRWATAEPPWIPDQTGVTLMFPSEVAVLIDLASMATEHDLPLTANTVPWLPAPDGLVRARQRRPPKVPATLDAEHDVDNGYRVAQRVSARDALRMNATGRRRRR